MTGGTGVIGRHLIEELLRNREGDIVALVGESSTSRLETLHRTHWGRSDRIRPLVVNLDSPSVGIAPTQLEQRKGTAFHFFHLAAPEDLAVSSDSIRELTVGRTRAAIALATALEARTFHQVSSVAVAGDHHGQFDETMFDEGQQLPSPYHVAGYESERLVREECAVPWRIYRPAIVVGHSESGATDEVDGPYHLFPALKLLRDTLPQWVPLLAVDLGDTNLVPVDYVSAAIDYLAHAERVDGQTFHLVNPEPQAILDVVNTLAAAAGAPRFAVPMNRRVTAALPTALVPINVVMSVLKNGVAERVLAETIGRLGIPPDVLVRLVMPSTFASRQTERALADSGISCPALETYAPALWDYWEQHLDTSSASRLRLPWVRRSQARQPAVKLSPNSAQRGGSTSSGTSISPAVSEP